MKSARATVIQLGCCHEEVRCRLCAPPVPAPTVPFLRAARAEAGGPVRFFGGPPPPLELVEAAGPGSIARVRPDLLDQEQAARLRDCGMVGIELDALSFDRETLLRCGRRYRADRLDAMIEGLADLGFEVGVVLGVGLPGSDRTKALADARHLTRARVDTVRLHPTLVFRDTGLWHLHLDGFYVPLTLPQAVDACRAMMDILEPEGVKVIRVGQQPGPDELGRCVAGPHHSGFRELVEAERTLDTLRALLIDMPRRANVVIRCATEDETRTRGPLNDNVRTLRAEFQLAELEIRADPSLDRGAFILEAV